jgi:hypothetical protein
MQELIFFVISKNFGIKIKEKTINQDTFNHIYLIKLKNNYLYGFFLESKDLLNIYKNHNPLIIKLNKINIIDQLKLPLLKKIQNNLINILKETNLNLLKVLVSLIKKIIKFNLTLKVKLINKIYTKANKYIEDLKKKYNLEIHKDDTKDNEIILKIILKSNTQKDIKKELKKISKILQIPLKHLKNNQIDYEFNFNENYEELYKIFFILKNNKKTLKYKYKHTIFPNNNLNEFLNNFKDIFSNLDKNFINETNTNKLYIKKIIVFIPIRNIEQIIKDKKYIILENQNIIFFISSFTGFLIYDYFDYILIFDSYTFKKNELLNKLLNFNKNINKIFLNYLIIKDNKDHIKLIYEKLNKIKEKLHPYDTLMTSIKNNSNINNEFININNNFNWWYFTQHNKFYYIYCNNCLNKPYCENCNSIIKEKINLKINKSIFNKLYTKLKYKKINIEQMINNLVLECKNCGLKYDIFNCQYCDSFNWKIKIFDPQKYINHIQNELKIKLNKIDYQKIFSFYYDIYLINLRETLKNNLSNIIIFDYYFLEFPFIIKELNIIFNLLELERIFKPKYFYSLENKEFSLIEYISTLTIDINNFEEHMNNLLYLEEKIRKINTTNK